MSVRAERLFLGIFIKVVILLPKLIFVITFDLKSYLFQYNLNINLIHQDHIIQNNVDERYVANVYLLFTFRFVQLQTR